MSDFLTLAQAAAHLRIATYDAQDAQLKLDQAEAIVWNRIKASQMDADNLAAVEAWTDETIPQEVIAAMLVQFGELYRFRGDDDVVTAFDPNRLSPAVERLIGLRVDPPLA